MLHKVICRLLRWKPFTFQHEAGPTHTVYARSETIARRKMRSFIQARMSAESLTYDPKAVDDEMHKVSLVKPSM